VRSTNTRRAQPPFAFPHASSITSRRCQHGRSPRHHPGHDEQRLAPGSARYRRRSCSQHRSSSREPTVGHGFTISAQRPSTTRLLISLQRSPDMTSTTRTQSAVGVGPAQQPPGAQHLHTWCTPRRSRRSTQHEHLPGGPSVARQRATEEQQLSRRVQTPEPARAAVRQTINRRAAPGTAFHLRAEPVSQPPAGHPAGSPVEASCTWRALRQALGAQSPSTLIQGTAHLATAGRRRGMQTHQRRKLTPARTTVRNRPASTAGPRHPSATSHTGAKHQATTPGIRPCGHHRQSTEEQQPAPGSSARRQHRRCLQAQSETDRTIRRLARTSATAQPARFAATTFGVVCNQKREGAARPDGGFAPPTHCNHSAFGSLQGAASAPHQHPARWRSPGAPTSAVASTSKAVGRFAPQARVTGSHQAARFRQAKAGGGQNQASHLTRRPEPMPTTPVGVRQPGRTSWVRLRHRRRLAVRRRLRRSRAGRNSAGSAGSARRYAHPYLTRISSGSTRMSPA